MVNLEPRTAPQAKSDLGQDQEAIKVIYFHRIHASFLYHLVRSWSDFSAANNMSDVPAASGVNGHILTIMVVGTSRLFDSTSLCPSQ